LADTPIRWASSCFINGSPAASSRSSFQRVVLPKAFARAVIEIGSSFISNSLLVTDYARLRIEIFDSVMEM
jgi:hypothetical protein